MARTRTLPESCKTVVLLHQVSDGSSHYDWLIDVPSDDYDQAAWAAHPPERIPTFRLDIDPLSSAGVPPWAPAFRAERLGDHRRHYLSYEGPVSGGRGTVVRVNSGRVLAMRDGPGRLIAVIQTERAGAVEYTGHADGRAWRFECVPVEPAAQ